MYAQPLLGTLRAIYTDEMHKQMLLDGWEAHKTQKVLYTRAGIYRKVTYTKDPSWSQQFISTLPRPLFCCFKWCKEDADLQQVAVQKGLLLDREATNLAVRKDLASLGIDAAQLPQTSQTFLEKNAHLRRECCGQVYAPFYLPSCNFSVYLFIPGGDFERAKLYSTWDPVTDEPLDVDMLEECARQHCAECRPS